LEPGRRPAPRSGGERHHGPGGSSFLKHPDHGFRSQSRSSASCARWQPISLKNIWRNKEYLARPSLIIFVYCVLVACSILAQYGFNLLQVDPNNRLDQWLMWTIMAASCGTIFGIGWLTGAVSTKQKLGSSHRARRRLRNHSTSHPVLHCNGAALGSPSFAIGDKERSP
jgi:hypothetical protein